MISKLKLYFNKLIKNKKLYPLEDGGVALTFDDNYTDEWLAADHILKKYNWKATFFVSYLKDMSDKQFDQLLELQNCGHEIGGHGYNHYNQCEYISNHGTVEYMNNEIRPMIEKLGKKSINLNSFAYPFGSRDEKLDDLLLNQFNILRRTTYGKINPKDQLCFFNKQRLIFGLGIDESYEHFSKEYLLELLSYAGKTKQILILYCHKPVY